MISTFKLFKESSENKKKDILFLIGPPGSGKSTYIKKLQKLKEFDIINRDDIAIEIAESNNLTYLDLFNRPNSINTSTKQIIPNESNFFIENGKKYLKGFEKYGEVIPTPESSFMSKFSSVVFKKIQELNQEIEDTLKYKLDRAIKKNHNIIIDMVNNVEYNRRQIINKIDKKYYKIIAIIFNNGGKGMEDTLINVNKIRDNELAKLNRNKNIPEETIIKFINKYEPPTKSEGFDKIINVSTKENLEKLIKRNETY
jgi:energy-coupling factor transporter ATP-binding protein EcfA2